MGVLKMENKEFDEAVRYYERAYEIAERQQLPSEIARITLNIGNVYSDLQENEIALEYYRQSLAVCEEIGLKYGIILNKLNLGNVYYKTGEYQLSESNLLVAYEYLKENQIKKDLSVVTRHLYRTYRSMGELEKSIQFMEEYMDLRGQLYDIEKTELTEDLRFRYEVDLKDQQILLAEAEVREKSAENRILGLTSVFLVVLMIGSVGYYKHRNQHLRMLYERNVEIMNAYGLDTEILKPVDGTDGNSVEKEENKEEKRSRELFEKLTTVMLEEKLYKDPDLQLAKLSMHMQTNDRYLSQAITSMSGMYFNQFINTHRINEAKRLILHGEESITEIQLSCGFKAKSTFYLAFKKSTGMSPAQFLNQHRQVQSQAKTETKTQQK